MMLDVKVPELPESIDEATLMAWHKRAGDTVRRDEKLADIETDKVVLEVAAQQDGVLKEILAEEGQTIRRGDLLARLEQGAAGATSEPPPKKAEPGKQTRCGRITSTTSCTCTATCTACRGSYADVTTRTVGRASNR